MSLLAVESGRESPPARTGGFWAWRLLWLSAGLAVVWRVVRFAQRPSLWGDEAFLLYNVLEADLSRLLTGRLDLATPLAGSESTQAAPPGLLVALKALHLAGWLDRPIDEWTARAIPLACSVVAVVLVAALSWRVLREWAWAAVLIFAASREVIFQAATVKQYSGDVMAAAAVACLALLPRWSLSRRWAAITIAGLAAMAVSHAAVVCVPAALVATTLREPGGLGRILHDILRLPGRAAAAIACLSVMLAGMWALKTFNVDVQHDPFLAEFWVGGFADFARPWTIPTWLGATSWELLNYASPGLGIAPAFIAAALVVRRGVGWSPDERAAWAALLGPWLLVMVAAVAGLFPYSGNRVNLFLVPGLIVASTLAAKTVWDVSGAWWRAIGAVWVGGVAAVAVVMAVHGAVTGSPSNGAFRELAERAARERPADAQLASLQGVLVDLHDLGTRYGFRTPAAGDQLDPDRPVVVVQSHRRRTRSDDALLAHPAFATRSVLRQQLLPGGVIYLLSEVNPPQQPPTTPPPTTTTRPDPNRPPATQREGGTPQHP